MFLLLLTDGGQKNLKKHPVTILNAFFVQEAKRLSEIDPASFDKLVVVDGTWDQAKMMLKSESPLLRMKRGIYMGGESLVNCWNLLLHCTL